MDIKLGQPDGRVEIHPNAKIEAERIVTQIKAANVEKKSKESSRDIENVCKDMASYFCDKARDKVTCIGGYGPGQKGSTGTWVFDKEKQEMVRIK